MINRRTYGRNKSFLLVLILLINFYGVKGLTAETYVNCPQNRTIADINSTVKSNRFQKVINQLDILPSSYQQKIKNYFYRADSGSFIQLYSGWAAYILIPIYVLALVACFIIYRVWFSNKNKNNQKAAGKYYCWEVFLTFLLNIILIFFLMFMGIALWTLIPQIQQHVNYSKCALYNSLDTGLNGNIDQNWIGVGPLYKQYQRLNKSNQILYQNLEISQKKIESISHIISELTQNKESRSLNLDIKIPQDSKFYAKSKNIKAQDILSQFNQKITELKQKQLKGKKPVQQLRGNFHELTTLQPLRNKAEQLRRNLYQLDVYQYKEFNASTVKRLQKLYFTMLLTSIISLVGFVLGGVYSRFQSLIFIKFGYWTYWLVFFGLIYAVSYSFLYWSFTFVSCSASDALFKSEKNFHYFGNYYEPSKLDVCFFGEGNFTQKNFKLNSTNQIALIINQNAEYNKYQASVANLIQGWASSIASAKNTDKLAQKQKVFVELLRQKMTQMIVVISHDKNESTSNINIGKMRSSFNKIQEMNKKTNCKVFKNQIYFMQTSVCDNLSVLQFNNFIFTLILMIILFGVLLITPFTINMLDQMNEAKPLMQKIEQQANGFFKIQKRQQDQSDSPVRLTGRRFHGV